MKSLFLFSLFFLYCLPSRAEVQQDIVFKSRFDMQSSEAFINQVRIFLVNNNFGDPYSQELKKPLTVDLSKVIEEMPPDTQEWLSGLQSVLKLKLFESNYKLVVDNFGYNISHFNSELRPGVSTLERVEYVTLNYVHGLRLKADRIAFELVLQHTQDGPIKFSIELFNPEFIVHPELTTELLMGWATSVLPQNVLLSMESINIQSLMDKVVKNPHLIDFRMKDLLIPTLSLRIGSKEINFSEEKIKRFFVSNQNNMKKGILDLIHNKLKDNFQNIIKDKPQKVLLPKSYGMALDINGVLDIQTIDVNNTGILQFEFGGHFCEDLKSFETDFCRNDKIPAKLRRKITIAQYRKSLREMNRTLIERKKNISVSVSENYLNQLIEATIRAGLWEEVLAGKEFSLGPEKSFVLADEKGDFSLYLDIIYKLKGSQRLLVGRSELRFPIKFMIGLKIEETDGMPRFKINVKKVATDHNLLLNGVDEFGLPSDVDAVPRFRSKVLKEIMKEVSTFTDNTLVDVELPELKGTYLDQLEFFSDGQGRGTATIGFKTLGTL